MSDIAERLRDLALDYPDKPWISEAADEIERLRGDLHYCKGTCDLAMEQRDAVEAEIERLRDVDAKRFALFQARNDEIERLAQALDDECTAHQVCVQMRDIADGEAERLRAKLAEYENAPVRLRHIMKTGTKPPDDMK